MYNYLVEFSDPNLTKLFIFKRIMRLFCLSLHFTPDLQPIQVKSISDQNVSDFWVLNSGFSVFALKKIWFPRSETIKVTEVHSNWPEEAV